MRMATQRKIASGVALTMAIVGIVLFIIGQIEGRRMAELWPYHPDVDAMQRHIRFIVTFLLAGLALRSRRWTKRALVGGLALFALIELFTWLPRPRAWYGDRWEPEIHILSATALGIAVALWIRRCNNIVIATVGFIYILGKFPFWYLYTQRVWRSSGGTGDPARPLQNVLGGAGIWDIGVLIVATLLSIWGIAATVALRRGDPIETGQGDPR